MVAQPQGKPTMWSAECDAASVWVEPPETLMSDGHLISPDCSPGMSTSVRFGTIGEYTVSWMGSGATALPFPFRYRFVSASISSRIASAQHQQV